MTDETTTAPEAEAEVINCLPWDTMTKKEMLDHLRTFHGVYPGYSDTISALTRLHESGHENQRMIYQHDHKSVSEDEAGLGDYDNPELLAALEKPLTQSQRAQLKSLVNNDFDSLRREIEEAVVRERYARQQELMREANEFQVAINDIRQRWHSAIDEFERTAAGLEKELIAAGAEERKVRLYRSVDRSLRVESAQLNRKQRELEADLVRQKSAALLALERRRLAVQRQIMLAGLPKETMVVLEALPKAADLMREASQKQIAQ